VFLEASAAEGSDALSPRPSRKGLMEPMQAYLMRRRDECLALAESSLDPAALHLWLTLFDTYARLLQIENQAAAPGPCARPGIRSAGRVG